MRVKIKICCISSDYEAQTAIAEGADALGLVAHMPSGPGTISDDKIASIISSVPILISTFMLTSEITANNISSHINKTQPSTVQIVSHIKEEESKKLAKLQPSIQRVQVIHVEGEEALDLIPKYAPHVHAFLLDSGRPNAKTPELGGTGRTHDWAISQAFVKQSPLPVFLAGGLRSENVQTAIREVRPYGIDVCSGVRTHGKLDQYKLRAFIATAIST